MNDTNDKKPSVSKSPFDVCGGIIDGALFLITTDERTLNEIEDYFKYKTEKEGKQL